MNSMEKVQAQLDALDHVEDVTQLDPSTAAAFGLVQMMRGQLLALLPDTPEQLDQLLAKGAVWALGLRSDDADPLMFDAIGAYESSSGEPLPVVDADHGGVQ